MNKKEKLKRIFTYANILSLSRIFMAIPLVMSLDKGWFDESIRYQVCFWILLAIFLSDVLDGPLARWTDQVTNVGKIIDPVADKICMMVALICVKRVHLMRCQHDSAHHQASPSPEVAHSQGRRRRTPGFQNAQAAPSSRRRSFDVIQPPETLTQALMVR